MLQSLGIAVYRPDEVTAVKKIRTPTFESEVSSASNVRDLTLVYRDKIVETPTFIRNRYFENMQLYGIFSKMYDDGKGGQWIRAPHTKLTDATIDLADWKDERDFSRCP